MTTVRLLALDLDGTLLNSRGHVSPGNLDALTAAAARGVTVSVVTGRSAGSAHHFAGILARATGVRVPFVACNGAGVYSPAGKLEIDRPIPPALLLPCLQTLRQAGLLVSCYTRERVVVDRAWHHFRAYWRPRRPSARSLCQVLATTWQFVRTNRIKAVWDLHRWVRERPEPILKLFAVAPTADLGPLQAAAHRLGQTLPGLHLTRSSADNLEVSAPQIHKGWGLRVLAERLHIPRPAVMAVGDGLNDLEMLEWAGVGVAMGNAPESVRARVALIVPTCDEDGVAVAVRRYVLGEEP